jgi:hypothetical protein
VRIRLQEGNKQDQKVNVETKGLVEALSTWKTGLLEQMCLGR